MHTSGVAIKTMHNELTLTVNIHVCVHDNVVCTVYAVHARQTCQGARLSRTQQCQLQAKKLTIYFMKTTSMSVINGSYR